MFLSVIRGLPTFSSDHLLNFLACIRPDLTFSGFFSSSRISRKLLNLVVSVVDLLNDLPSFLGHFNNPASLTSPSPTVSFPKFS